MIVNQLQTLHAQAVQSVPPAVCGGDDALRDLHALERAAGAWRPGASQARPKRSAPGLAGLQTQLRRLEHGPHRSHGTTALYAEHRSQISRRSFLELVEETRRQILREREADRRRRPLASARQRLVGGPHRVGARARWSPPENPHATGARPGLTLQIAAIRERPPHG